jgi:hypothetical protein
VTDVALGTAGLHISTTSNEAALGTLTTSVAGAGQVTRLVTTATVLVLEAELTDHTTAARRLTDLHPGWTERCAKTTAAVAAAVAYGTFDAAAVRSHGDGKATRANALAFGDVAASAAAIVVARADVAVLDAIGRTDEAFSIFTKLRTTGVADRAGVARRAAAWIEGGAYSVAAALTATLAVVPASAAVRGTLGAAAFALSAVHRAAICR